MNKLIPRHRLMMYLNQMDSYFNRFPSYTENIERWFNKTFGKGEKK